MSIYANLLKSIHDFLLGCNKTAAAKFGGQFKYLSIYQSGYFFNFRSLRSIVNILGQYEIYFFHKSWGYNITFELFQLLQALMFHVEKDIETDILQINHKSVILIQPIIFLQNHGHNISNLV